MSYPLLSGKSHRLSYIWVLFTQILLPPLVDQTPPVCNLFFLCHTLIYIKDHMIPQLITKSLYVSGSCPFSNWISICLPSVYTTWINASYPLLNTCSFLSFACFAFFYVIEFTLAHISCPTVFCFPVPHPIPLNNLWQAFRHIWGFFF